MTEVYVPEEVYVVPFTVQVYEAQSDAVVVFEVVAVMVKLRLSVTQVAGFVKVAVADALYVIPLTDHV